MNMEWRRKYWRSPVYREERIFTTPTGNLILDFKPIIEEKIEHLARDYQRIKGLILTESDLKFHLLLKLVSIRELSAVKNTLDNHVASISIHSELTWYDKFGRLSITPDISIIEPEHLRILEMQRLGFKLPSKGYAFRGKAIVFELKFVKYSRGLTRDIFNKQITKDFDKIQELKSKLDNQGVGDNIFCYFVIFNKTNIKCQEFNEFLTEHNDGDYYKIIYKTGNVEF